MALHPSIERPLDPNRINGLVGEDRIRTTGMFVRGNLAWHPTHPIDISPEADLIQGLPTHVKTVKQTYNKKGKPNPITVDMACAHQLFHHDGYHRLIVMVYEPDYEEMHAPDGTITKRTIVHRDENGKRVTVNRFDTIIEIILSSETWKAMRGGITRMEIARLRSLLLAWNPEVSNEDEANAAAEEARDRYHPITAGMRKRQGFAHPSVKLSMAQKLTKKTGLLEWKPDNKRVQCSISLNEVIDHVRNKEDNGRDRYDGKITQERCLEYRGDSDHMNNFHGLQLPWRTTGRWPKAMKVKQTYQKVAAPSSQIPVTGDAKYVQSWVSSTARQIPGCELTIMKHDDRMRTLYADSDDDEVLKHVSRVCRHVGGRWISEAGCWLLSPPQVVRAVASLDPRDLPPAPNTSLLRGPLHGNPNLFKFDTTDGVVVAYRLQSDNWVIRPDGKPRNAREKAALQTRIDAACRACSIHRNKDGEKPIGQWYHNAKDDHWNWLVSQEPKEAIERVASAIIWFTHLGNPAPSFVAKIAKSM